MFIDIAQYGVRVIMKNTGESSYMQYPRDVEGTVIGMIVENKNAVKTAESGDLRSLFDIEYFTAKLHVRWDNDTRGTYSTVRLHIREFGALPGMESIWDEGTFLIDLRPYHTLKPMTRHKTPTYSSTYGKIPVGGLDKYQSIGKQYYTTTAHATQREIELGSRALKKTVTMDFEVHPIDEAYHTDTIEPPLDEIIEELCAEPTPKPKRATGKLKAYTSNYGGYGNVSSSGTSYSTMGLWQSANRYGM